MNKSQEQYKNIPIPKELNTMINETILHHRNKKRTFISLVASVAALCIFTLSLNLSETFAETISEIPLLSNIAQILTIRSYGFETDTLKGQVTLPAITVEDQSLENTINDMISSAVDDLLSEAQLRADEYKEAFIATGGTEEEYANKNMQVSVDYEVFLQDENYLSFRVFTNETLAAVYAENLYFNIDLKTQKSITLERLVGKNYQKIISEVIQNEVAKEPDLYFDEVKDPNWTIRPETSFYLTNKNLVVVLEKYEIGPGAMGRLEFFLEK